MSIAARPAARLRDGFWSVAWHLKRLPDRAVRLGVPPRAFGWRWRRREAILDYAARPDTKARVDTVLPERRVQCPLPRTVDRRSDLDTNGHLWGYSLHDVPDRTIASSFVATLRDCHFLFHDTPDKRDFFPALIGPDGRSIEAREISHRAPHSANAGASTAKRVARGTWFCERAYHNHSHWLTAHLPKLLLLRERGELDDLLLPKRRTQVMDASMRALGIDPDACIEVDTRFPLAVDELTLVQTDRFDPLHMNAVRDAFATGDGDRADRKVLISRSASRGRRLLNEDRLWAMLEPRGFERVRMEDLDFTAQVELMQQTRILLAPHGAGLTNMIFCPPGGHVVEMADPGFPNPNFYALSCGLGLDYWLLHADATHAAHPLDRDLSVDVEAVAGVLDRIA